MNVPFRGGALWLARAAFAAVLCFSPVAGIADVNGLPRLTWYGQSCFLLETAAGARVLMDPGGPSLQLPPDGIAADLVTISHEHPDHAHLGSVTGAPKIVRGLTPDKKGWLKINDKLRDVAWRTIGVYHDDQTGAARGLNTIFVFETGGLRIAHLGDLGHTLSDRQLSELGQVDVVLVPVGGTTTIDADRAARVVDQIRPRLTVVPMHYKTSASATGDLDTVDAFTAGRPHVRKLDGQTLTLTAVKKRPGAEVVVLRAP